MAAAGNSSGGAGAVRAGRAYVEVFTKDAGVNAGLAGIRNKILKFGASLTRISSGVGVLAGGGGILAPLLFGAKDSLKVGGDLADMADRLGAPIEELNALGYAAKLAGEDLAGVETAVGKLQQAIADNKQVGDLNAGALLGLPLPQQMDAIANAIAGVTDPALRMRLAVDLFGKAGRKMIPVLSEGASGMRRWREEAARVTGVTEGSAKAFDAAGDSLTTIWESLTSITRSVVGTLFSGAESIQIFTMGMTQGVVVIREWIAANSVLVAKVFLVVGAVAALTVAVGALNLVISTLMLNPIVFASAALLAVIGGLIVAFTDFSKIGTSFQQAWQGVTDAIKSGDMALAAKIAFTSLKLEAFKAFDSIIGEWRLLAAVMGGSVFGTVAAMNIASLGVRIEVMESQLKRWQAEAAKAAKAVAVPGGGGVLGAFLGTSKGAFGTSRQIGMQTNIGDGAKLLSAAVGTEKNTASIDKKMERLNQPVWAV